MNKGIYGCKVFMLVWELWEYLPNIWCPKSPKTQTPNSSQKSKRANNNKSNYFSCISWHSALSNTRIRLFTRELKSTGRVVGGCESFEHINLDIFGSLNLGNFEFVSFQDPKKYQFYVFETLRPSVDSFTKLHNRLVEHSYESGFRRFWTRFIKEYLECIGSIRECRRTV